MPLPSNRRHYWRIEMPRLAGADWSWRHWIWLILAALCLTQPSPAATWPSTPIRVIIPFAPGSIVDIVPRIVFGQISERFHQEFLIENRPGAGSLIGEADVAKAAPDGTTILVTSSAHVIAPLIHKPTSFNPERDLSPITSLGIISDALVVSPTRHFDNLDQFVYWARSTSDPVTFASLGVGSGIYMNALRFARSARLSPVNISFKGAPEALSEVMAGRVVFCLCAIGTARPHIESGKLTALAVSGIKRSPLLPGVPTTAETGYANSEYSPWLGVFAPVNTPRNVIDRLQGEIAGALNANAVRNKLKELGVEPTVMSPDEFDRFVKKDRNLNAALLHATALP